jgi:sugar phosphate isomerase/epimerase
VTSRRQFLIGSGMATLASTMPLRRARAHPLGKPAGIQLYTVNEPMKTDAAGTLKQLKAIGYGEVESAGFGTLSAKEFGKLITDAGLVCPSAHLSFDPKNLGQAFDDAHALGAEYAVSSSLHDLVIGQGVKRDMTRDDAKRTAELANKIGAAAKKAGLRYAYHNHAGEFVDVGAGLVAYDVLLEKTDAALVEFEIDCGWMTFGGKNPVDYFQRYPQRFPMIHVKDYERRESGDTDMRGTELGRGVVDYPPIFAAGAKAGLKHYFAEQEGPFSRLSQIEAARVDYAFLHSLHTA